MGFSNKRRTRLDRVLAKKQHRPFTVRELMRDIPDASRASIDMALSRMAYAGEVRRLGRGVYDVPKQHPTLGPLPADPVQVANAVARAQGAHLVPSGTLAANRVGISQQVPVKLVFRTTGASKRIRVGNNTIELRHSEPGRLRNTDPTTATVIEALRSVGKSGIDRKVMATLRFRLTPDERDVIAKAAPDAPVWMHPYLRELAEK